MYQLNTDKRLARLLILAKDMSEAAFIDLYEREFQPSDDQLWTAYLFDHETDTLIFSTEANGESVSRTEIEATLAAEAVIENGVLTGVFGVSHSYIAAIVQSDITEVIHHQTYENDAYIWVNEVVNYEGGKDYAIRRIHPNLIETEGDYLSTTMTDAVEFCQMNYGVEFPIFSKIDVNGTKAHPLFQYLKDAQPFEGFDETTMNGKLIKKIVSDKYPEWMIGNDLKWNFTKFLVNREGVILKRYEPTAEPMDFEKDIQAVLA